MLRSTAATSTTRRGATCKDKIRSAQAFIRNVDRRKDTVSRIAQIILETQSEFFEDGKGPLRPLRLEDVAVEMGVHLSTISRGVTGKYMSTPYGLFELKHFFSGGYRTSTGHGRRVDHGQGAASARCSKAEDADEAALRPAARGAAGRGGRPRRPPHGREVPRGARHRAVVGAQAEVSRR